jgi:hypothetical protein
MVSSPPASTAAAGGKRWGSELLEWFERFEPKVLNPMKEADSSVEHSAGACFPSAE